MSDCLTLLDAGQVAGLPRMRVRRAEIGVMDDAEYLRRRVVRTRAEWMAGYLRVLEARDARTSSKRLAVLATDEIRAVRVWTARHRRCPATSLDALARDYDVLVRWNALSNVAMPEGALRYLAEVEAAEYEARNLDARYAVIRVRVLRHPNAGRNLKRELRESGVVDPSAERS